MAYKDEDDDWMDDSTYAKCGSAIVIVGFLGILAAVGVMAAAFVFARDANNGHSGFGSISDQLTDAGATSAAMHEGERVKNLVRTCSHELDYTAVPRVVVQRVTKEEVKEYSKKKKGMSETTNVIAFESKSQNFTDVFAVGDEVKVCGCHMAESEYGGALKWNSRLMSRTFTIRDIFKEELSYGSEELQVDETRSRGKKHVHKNKEKKFKYTAVTTECSDHLDGFDGADCTCDSPMYMVSRPDVEEEEEPKKKHRRGYSGGDDSEENWDSEDGEARTLASVSSQECNCIDCSRDTPLPLCIRSSSGEFFNDACTHFCLSNQCVRSRVALTCNPDVGPCGPRGDREDPPANAPEGTSVLCHVTPGTSTTLALPPQSYVNHLTQHGDDYQSPCCIEE